MINPTASQISTIFQPYRSHLLRVIAARHIDGCQGSAIWLRTDYSDDEASYRLWQNGLYESREGAPDCVILSDPSLFNYVDGTWEQLLEVLPEICTNSGSESDLSLLRPAQEEWKRAWPEDKTEAELHVQCLSVAGMILVEDKYTHQNSDSQIRQIMVDYWGNVVKEVREDPDQAGQLASDIRYVRLEGTPVMLDGDVGAEYCVGGSRAPPYDFAETQQTQDIGKE